MSVYSVCGFQKLVRKLEFSESFGISPNGLLLTAVPSLLSCRPALATRSLRAASGQDGTGVAVQEPVLLTRQQTFVRDFAKTA